MSRLLAKSASSAKRSLNFRFSISVRLQFAYRNRGAATYSPTDFIASRQTAAGACWHFSMMLGVERHTRLANK
ncbi:MAG: hypothetical protein QM831_44895 [Kofleriaceae bacterium]